MIIDICVGACLIGFLGYVVWICCIAKRLRKAYSDTLHEFEDYNEEEEGAELPVLDAPPPPPATVTEVNYVRA
jgi:hypothetical protein